MLILRLTDRQSLAQLSLFRDDLSLRISCNRRRIPSEEEGVLASLPMPCLELTVQLWLQHSCWCISQSGARSCVCQGVREGKKKGMRKRNLVSLQCPFFLRVHHSLLRCPLAPVPFSAVRLLVSLCPSASF